MSDSLHKIALSMLPGVGPINARKLVAYLGSPEAVFAESKQKLLKIPGIGEYLAQQISQADTLHLAEKELEFTQKHKIEVLFYTDPTYPKHLALCDDAPTVLYFKGKLPEPQAHTLAIVGTRNATHYGRQFCDELIREIAAHKIPVVIVSGLAYGIDIAAHKAALEHHIPTIGVLAHGLSMLYPTAHKTIATQMLHSGGLLTQFDSNEKAYRNNFLSRNRIIAGMSEATILVESAEKGGALVTATIADAYKRPVFALPGRVNDPYSKGCNQLIQSQKAQSILSPTALLSQLNWLEKPHATTQKRIPWDLQPNQQLVFDTLRQHGEQSIDSLCRQLQMPMHELSATLLDLEFAGYIKALAGKRFIAD